jgi:signal transduction histidine kinase
MHQIRPVHDLDFDPATKRGVGGSARVAGAPGPHLHLDSAAATNRSTHALQVYEDEAFFARSVAGFLAGGLTMGRPAIIVATAAHHAAVLEALKEWHSQPAHFVASGQLRQLDAQETLGKIMDGREPSAQRFTAVLGTLIAQTARDCGGGSVYVHGEMVDLLWRDGKPEAATQLEALWNALSNELHFHLLCTYPMADFADSSQVDAFEAVCSQHGRVYPTERYTEADDEGRLREVAGLQQRARALEAELVARQRLEAELREALAERERVQQAMRRAWQEAEAANRAKSEFLAVMSHELRTPLNAIGGYVDLLELGVRGPVTVAQREDLARIQKSQRHLLGLINEVLNYTRIETGAMRYDLADIRLGDVVNAAEPLIRPQLELSGLALVIDRRASSMVVRADSEKVRQVLLNLLSNAVKFTDRGGSVSIGCEAATDAAGRAMVQLHVCDTGEGIPVEKLEAVFEPFVQVHTGLTRPHEGTGLGLAISRDLARGMGGDLTVRSRRGAGSVFTLWLQRA